MSVLIFLLLALGVQGLVYEETSDDMLSQCNLHQYEVVNSNRTKHLCEKSDLDDDFSYFITELETRFSKQKFWCFLFFKEDYIKLKFKLWFSHPNYSVNAYGVKYNKPNGDRWESSIKFKISSLIVLPKGTIMPQIFGFELNGQDKCPFCGQRLQSVGLIAAGRESKPAKWPWHSALFYVEHNKLAYKCGASVIRDNFVLTAAHCVTKSGQPLSEKIFKIKIVQGDLLSASSYDSNVYRSNIHENYDYQTFENDIALLTLESKITFTTHIQPICLSTPDLKFKTVGVAVGFGSTEKSTDHSNVLREVEIPIVTSEVCHDSDPDFFGSHLFPGNFCAGQVGVQKGVCQGDSGGGLYVEKDNLWFLKGITSNTKQNVNAANPSCNQAAYALFTDVSKYLDWIDEKIKFTI